METAVCSVSACVCVYLQRECCKNHWQRSRNHSHMHQYKFKCHYVSEMSDQHRDTLGDKCELLYASNKTFVNECDSRFTLRYKNDSVLLHLVNLTSEDSGIYSCDCSYERGTLVIHHDITVEDGERDASKRFSSVKFIAKLAIAVTVIAMSVVTAWIICDHIQRRSYPRENAMSQASASTRCETPWHLDQDDVYASLQHPDTDVYHTFHPSRPYLNTQEDPDSNLEDGREKDLHEFAVYETIQN
ncbi:hypothetical protein INR49_000951 [Caranx melampygus]|nr:hypothetical protein INR49_000951 [Caranx melampygus]